MPSAEQYYNPTTKIWTAKSRPYAFGDKCIGVVLHDSLSRDPEKVVEVNHDTGKSITRKQLNKFSTDFARSIRRQGLKDEDVVLLILANHEYSSACMIGTLYIGAVFCDLELGLDRSTMRSLVKQLEPKLVICELNEFEQVKSVLDELNFRVPLFAADDHHPSSVRQLFEDQGPVETFEAFVVEDVENKVAAVVSSSATQGVYKLCSLSHPMLMHNYSVDFGLIQVTFSFSTLNWITGIALTIGSCIIAGVRRIYTNREFDPDLLLEIIETHGVNMLILQPDRLNATLKTEKIKNTNFESLYLLMVTGKPLSHHMKNKFEEYLISGGVVSTYGMTETAGTITSSLYATGKENSTGILVDNTRAKILNERGEKVGPGEVGEICIQTEFKFLGYYKNEKLTQDSTDSDGFFKTGDVGFFDNDGELFIVDRKKDTIVMGDKFVFPSVLESILTEHPDVSDACIIDMIHPELNFVPLAAIVRAKGSSVTENELIDFVAARQPPELGLKGGVVFVEKLPKTTSGKFKRYQVRQVVERTAENLDAKIHATR